MGNSGTFAVACSRRSLLSSREMVGSVLVSGLIFILGVVSAGTRPFGVSPAVAVLVPALISLGVLWAARRWMAVRLRPHFSLQGHYLRDAVGREFDLADFLGIQSWVDTGGRGKASTVNFTLIPSGTEARVDPKAELAATFSRNHQIPKELEAFTFCYPDQLSPPLHVFTAELQRRAPHLFLDHVGEI